MPVIPIALTLVFALLLWLVIGSKGHWVGKFALVILVPAFAFSVWHSLESYKGWPTHSTMPKNVVFLWGIVEEPNPITHDPGRIYIWAIPATSDSGPLGYKATTDEPRAYYFPYSLSLHKIVAQAEGEVEHGYMVGLSTVTQHGTAVDGQHIPKSMMHVYKLPAVQLPQKESP